MGRKPQPSNAPIPNFMVEEDRGLNPRGVSYDREYRDQLEAAKGVAQFGWESLPGVGTYYTVQDITEELEKENPNYLKIGALAGVEVIGLIPGIGDAAAALIKKGAKKAGFNKLSDSIPTTQDPTKQELIATERALKPEELPKLESAREQGMMGVDEEEVFQDTGLYFDEDTNLYRFEIDDTNAVFNTDKVDRFSRTYLDDALDHPEFFDRYPEAKNFTVQAVTKDELGGASASFSPVQQRIFVATDAMKENPDVAKNTLMHELQHGIQFLEDFDADVVSGVRGTNLPIIAQVIKDPEIDALRRDITKNYVKTMRAQVEAGYSPKSELDKIPLYPDRATLPESEGGEFVKELDTGTVIPEGMTADEFLIQLNDELLNLSYELKTRAFELYLKNAGEAEARVAGNRAVAATRGDRPFYRDMQDAKVLDDRSLAPSSPAGETYGQYITRAFENAADGLSRENKEDLLKFGAMIARPIAKRQRLVMEELDGGNIYTGQNPTYHTANMDTRAGIPFNVKYSPTSMPQIPRGKQPQMSNEEYDSLFLNLDEADNPKEWQQGAKTLIKKGRVADPSIKTPELEDSTRLLLENKITREEHLANVDKYKPVNAWDALPREPSDKALVFALDSNKRTDGLFVLDDATTEALGVAKSPLSVGMRFNGRLDIPAYNYHDTWIVAGTSPAVKGADGKGSVTTYAKAIHYVSDGDKPVKFVASNKKSEQIGTGEINKTGYATVSGIVGDLDTDAIRAKAAEYLNDPEWTQVGFDPRRQGGFYVRAGENKHVPVREATEVIQIGPLVLARNAKLDFEYSGYNEGGMAMDEQMDAVFKSSRTGYARGGMDLDSVPENTMGIDPESGNEIPLGSLPEEVRDDIPAQLSEGEYVVPADVVRYYGVKFFEDLRAEAKFGYQDMNENGRIGGEPMGMETVEPEDDMMFDISELEVVDDESQPMQMNQGGYAESGGYALSPGDEGYDEMGSLGLGSEGLTLGTGEDATGGAVEMVAYVNDEGRVIYIMHINGVPQNEIPAGFYPRTEEENTQTSSSTGAQPVAQVVREVGSDYNDRLDDFETPMPKGVDYASLTTEEMFDMLEEQQSAKMDVLVGGAAVVNPIMGLFLKGAMVHQARQLEKEIERRLDGELTTQERTQLEGLLKQSKEGKPGFIRRVYGALKDEFTGEKETKGPEAYTPEVAAGSVTKALSPETMSQIEQAAKDAADPTQSQEYLEAARKAKEAREAAAAAAAAAQPQPPVSDGSYADDTGYSAAGTGDVLTAMRDRGASEAAITAAEDEAAKVKESLKDQSRGIQRGFKKGGLASKRGKKKK